MPRLILLVSVAGCFALAGASAQAATLELDRGPLSKLPLPPAFKTFSNESSVHAESMIIGENNRAIEVDAIKADVDWGPLLSLKEGKLTRGALKVFAESKEANLKRFSLSENVDLAKVGKVTLLSMSNSAVLKIKTRNGCINSNRFEIIALAPPKDGFCMQATYKFSDKTSKNGTQTLAQLKKELHDMLGGASWR
jgi:hypothetical protein